MFQLNLEQFTLPTPDLMVVKGTSLPKVTETEYEPIAGLPAWCQPSRLARSNDFRDIGSPGWFRYPLYSMVGILFPFFGEKLSYQGRVGKEFGSYTGKDGVKREYLIDLTCNWNPAPFWASLTKDSSEERITALKENYAGLCTYLFFSPILPSEKSAKEIHRETVKMVPQVLGFKPQRLVYADNSQPFIPSDKMSVEQRQAGFNADLEAVLRGIWYTNKVQTFLFDFPYLDIVIGIMESAYQEYDKLAEKYEGNEEKIRKNSKFFQQQEKVFAWKQAQLARNSK